MEKTITLTVTGSEAQRIIRALRARASRWNAKATEAEEDERYAECRNIAEHYHALADAVEAQANAQR